MFNNVLVKHGSAPIQICLQANSNGKMMPKEGALWLPVYKHWSLSADKHELEQLDSYYEEWKSKQIKKQTVADNGSNVTAT